ncbi:uncharacterized protein LOC110446611 [Mizuhopecten yessoensis]|uniref:Collagen alpha-1(X) chain n=1 Tax=Mizuhopecten yessoensis TaxID=6573 RepID=A0A210QWX8_MIZYE|nr:uncharacterized protein LOC110446611 [Mizuhopecten yessoensis]OWF53279.1 Collagen alpha-1(X) chain [Mizuhopecten yessoensis]
MYLVLVFVVGALTFVCGQAHPDHGTGCDVAIRLEKLLADLTSRVDDLEKQRQVDHKKISDLRREIDEIKIENHGLKTELDDMTTVRTRRSLNPVPQPSTLDKEVDDTQAPTVHIKNGTRHTLKEGDTTLVDTGKTNRVGRTRNSPSDNKISHITDRVGEFPRDPTAFYARMGNNLNDVVRGQVIHFDKIVTNNGEHYDKNSGVFTCAEEGTYFFSWTLYTPNNHWVDSELVKNGEPIAWFRTGDSQFYEASSTTALVKLFPGDRVWTRVRDGPYGADLVALVSMFCGFKI